MHQFPLRLAAVCLIAGGLALGAAPLPLADYGCPPALAFSTPLDQTTDVVLACADDRADRQTAVGLLLTVGAAGLAAGVTPRRQTDAGAADAAEPPVGSGSRPDDT